MCVQHPHLSTSPDTLSHCLGHLSGSLPSSPSCSVSQHRWDIKNVTASQAGAGEQALCKTPCRSVSVTPCGPSTLPGLETGLCSDLSGSQDLHSPWAGGSFGLSLLTPNLSTLRGPCLHPWPALPSPLHIFLHSLCMTPSRGLTPSFPPSLGSCPCPPISLLLSPPSLTRRDSPACSPLSSPPPRLPAWGCLADADEHREVGRRSRLRPEVQVVGAPFPKEAGREGQAEALGLGDRGGGKETEQRGEKGKGGNEKNRSERKGGGRRKMRGREGMRKWRQEQRYAQQLGIPPEVQQEKDLRSRKHFGKPAQPGHRTAGFQRPLRDRVDPGKERVPFLFPPVQAGKRNKVCFGVLWTLL